MKKSTVGMPWIVAGAAMLIALGGASTARAQDTELVAHVPFAFVVGTSTLPAGDYLVRNPSDDDSVLAIASADGRRFVNTLTIPGAREDSSGKSQLIFDKVGSQYFLARIIPAGNPERDILLKPSELEREAEGQRSIAATFLRSFE